jgi:hypothetical protein
MFIRPCYRTKNGKRHAYWALLESYRTERGPRQRVVAYLGQLDEAQRAGVTRAAEGRQEALQQRLFDEVRPQWVEVDAKRVRVENRRDFGGPWLGLQLVEPLGLREFLDRTLPCGRAEISWSLMALLLVLCRLCDPSSERHIAEHFYAHSALSDLLGIAPEKINEQRLYRALDALLPHKAALEIFLKNRLGELFGLEYDLLLYDVTSTYFEGQAAANPLAKRGYSRDHRPDCKQVCIGLVVSQCGMPLGYEVFAGNRVDVTTLQEIVETMERRYGRADRIWVGVLWKTLAQRCQRAGLGQEPRRVFEELGKIQLVDVVLPTRQGPEIRRRCVTQPSDHQAILLTRLNLNLPVIPLMDGA